jgi:hypothetical protein
MGGHGSQLISNKMNIRHPEKLKILGAILELPAKRYCQSSPFTSKLGQFRNRQWSLAGTFQTAPRILIFSIAIGTDCSFYVKTIDTHARAFFNVIIS